MSRSRGGWRTRRVNATLATAGHVARYDLSGACFVFFGLRRGLSLLAIGAASLVTAATRVSAASVSLSSQYVGGIGTVLTDSAGRTLYTFTKDQAGVSNCYDVCATYWPPLISDAAPSATPGFNGNWGMITR